MTVPPWLASTTRRVAAAEARIRYRTGQAYQAANTYRRVNAARLSRVERQIAEANARLDHNLGVVEQNLANDAAGSAAARQHIAELVGTGLSFAEAVAVVAGAVSSAAYSFGDAKFESLFHGTRHDQEIHTYPPRGSSLPAGSIPPEPVAPGQTIHTNPRIR